MNPTSQKPLPIWLYPHLIGIDAALVPLCWGLVFAYWMGVNITQNGSLFISTTAIWSIAIAYRLLTGLPAQHPHSDFYRRNLWLLGMLFLALISATVWMMCFCIGRIMLTYAMVPAFLLGIALLLALFRRKHATRMFLGIALAQTCFIPALYSHYTTHPIELLRYPSISCIGFLFFFFLQCDLPLSNPTEQRDRSILRIAVLFLILVLALVQQSSFIPEQHMRYAAILTAAWLHLMCKQMQRFSPDVQLALRRPAMAIPAILAILIFV